MHMSPAASTQTVSSHLTLKKMLVFQATSDETASFCFNILDAGRRGLVSHDSFVTAIQGCAALALHQQAGANQHPQWAEATAAGNILPPDPAVSGHYTQSGLLPQEDLVIVANKVNTPALLQTCRYAEWAMFHV